MRMRTEIIALLLVMAFLALMIALSRPDQLHMPTGKNALLSPRTVRSSFGTYPNEYKALYLTLGELGYDARRLMRPYPELPPRGLLIVADPYREPVSPYEARVFFDWIRRGNHALILTEYHPEIFAQLAGGVPAPADAPTDDDDHDTTKTDVSGAPADAGEMPTKLAELMGSLPTPGEATPVRPSFLSAAAPTLTIASRVRCPRALPDALAARTGGAVPLYRDARGTAVQYSTVGQGGIVWCCSPWSFSTEGVREGHNLEFILALANLHAHDPIIFDEYHHGYGAGMTLWSLAPSMTRWGIAQCVLALCLLLYTLAWRFGPSRLPEAERFTRSRGEYLTSMAGLLERAVATHVVFGRLRQRFRRDLGRRLGLSVLADWTAVLEMNKRHPVVDHSALERVVARLTALEAQDRPAADALWKLAGEIERLRGT